jgi:nucleotide-binding universal stress UspA family protein
MRVLFPIDGSACAQKTLEWAVNFLAPEKHIVLLMIVIFPLLEKDEREVEERAANELLSSFKALFESHGFKVERAECVKEYILGNPAGAICKYADTQAVDQIIIGSHGYQGFARFLMGSVSMDVFQKARKPVLVLNNQLQQSGETSFTASIQRRK